MLLVCQLYRACASKRLYKFVNIDEQEQPHQAARFAVICQHKEVGQHVRGLSIDRISHSNEAVHQILCSTPNLVNLCLSWRCDNIYRNVVNPPQCLPTQPKFRLKRLSLDIFSEISINSCMDFIRIHQHTLQELQLHLQERSITYPVLEDTFPALRLCNISNRNISLDIMNRHRLRCLGFIPAGYLADAPYVLSIGHVDLCKVDQQFVDQFPNLRCFGTHLGPVSISIFSSSIFCF